MTSLRPVRLLRVWVSEGFTQADSYQGWEFECPYDFIGSLPESLTQGLLTGKLLIGGLGVRDKDLYTTTNQWLQCRIEIMYAVF